MGSCESVQVVYGKNEVNTGINFKHRFFVSSIENYQDAISVDLVNVKDTFTRLSKKINAFLSLVTTIRIGDRLAKFPVSILLNDELLKQKKATDLLSFINSNKVTFINRLEYVSHTLKFLLSCSCKPKKIVSRLSHLNDVSKLFSVIVDDLAMLKSKKRCFEDSLAKVVSDLGNYRSLLTLMGVNKALKKQITCEVSKKEDLIDKVNKLESVSEDSLDDEFAFNYTNDYTKNTSYVSVAMCDNYLKNHLDYSLWDALTLSEKQGVLLQVSLYIDSNFIFFGEKLNISQNLAFPRKFSSGSVSSGIPKNIKLAVFNYVIFFLKQRSFSSEGNFKSIKVGSTTVSFKDKKVFELSESSLFSLFEEYVDKNKITGKFTNSLHTINIVRVLNA